MAVVLKGVNDLTYRAFASPQRGTLLKNEGTPEALATEAATLLRDSP
ncbi:MAG: hypothetical protein VX916_04230 [Planctomycetota bacterium]|nr:hypothetical protein [Planctomycetota bacterium]